MSIYRLLIKNIGTMSESSGWIFLCLMVFFAASSMMLSVYFLYLSVRIWQWLKKNRPDILVENLSFFGFKQFWYLVNINEQQDPEKVLKWKKKARLTFIVLITMLIILFAFFVSVFKFFYPLQLAQSFCNPSLSYEALTIFGMHVFGN